MNNREARIDELKGLREALTKTLTKVAGSDHALREALRQIELRIAEVKAQPVGPMFQEEIS